MPARPEILAVLGRAAPPTATINRSRLLAALTAGALVTFTATTTTTPSATAATKTATRAVPKAVAATARARASKARARRRTGSRRSPTTTIVVIPELGLEGATPTIGPANSPPAISTTSAPTTTPAPTTSITPVPAAPTTTILITTPAPPPVATTLGAAVVPVSITPTVYLDAALERIQRASFKVQRNLVDIELIKANAHQKASAATNLAETYPAIREALAALGDGHSSFADPEAAKRLTQGTSTGFGFDRFRGGIVFPYPGSPAELAGMRDLDRIVAVNGRATEGPNTAEVALDTLRISVIHRGETAPIDLAVTKAVYDSARLPRYAQLGRIGYLDLPGTRGNTVKVQAFIQSGVAAVQTANQSDTCGWVLDLRRNTGGFPYPMFASIAPLLGDGLFLSQARTDRTDPWVLQGGRVLVNGVPVTDTGNAVPLRQPGLAIAILTSTSTASAGEAAALSMIGRGATRSFGEPTVGVTSTNVAYSLADGAVMQVTTSYDVDRTGAIHDGRIAPDQPMPVDWATLGTDADPVLAAANAWLNAQPSCQAPTPAPQPIVGP